MKRIIIALTLIGCSTVYAYISGKVPTGQKALYCPQTINCSSNNLDSCKFDSTDTNFLPKVRGPIAPPVDHYNFSTAETSFHSNKVSGNCRYIAALDSSKAELILDIKPEANLEAYYINAPVSAWVVAGDKTKCSASTVSLCPLKQRFGFIIHNVDLPDGVLASIDDKIISPLINTKTYASILFDEALVGCSGKECIIDLSSKKNVKYGSVKVDMDTMKVLQANIVEKTNEINKIDSFNIELKKIDSERAVYCPAEITCQNNNVKSCTLSLGDNNFFGELGGVLHNGGKQSFRFHSAHNDKADADSFYCEYDDYQSSDQLVLRPKKEAFLTTYYLHPDSLWKKSSQNWDCNSLDNPSLCPLKKSFGFVVSNLNISNPIIVSINGIDIGAVASIALFTVDKVSTGCNGEKECTIDLLSGKHAKFGSFKVDMSTMKIFQASSMYPGYIRINKIDDGFLSTVEIGYISL